MFVVGPTQDFCGAPVVPGSPYCAHHRRRCVVSRGTAAARRSARWLEDEARGHEAPPRELAFLAAIAVAELDSADEPQDLAGCIDLTQRYEARDE